MNLTHIAAGLLSLALAAQTPLPELKVEATDGGSALRIRNVSSQPVTAYLIELVGYPGSSYAFYHEGIAGRILAPGAEDRFPITNMTVGAAPDYVKMQAALFADGSSAGIPEKVTQLIGLRRTTLETTRELVTRLEKGKDGDPATLVEALRQWAGTIPEPAKRERGTPAAVARFTQRELISATAAQLGKGSVQEVLAKLTASLRAFAQLPQHVAVP